MLKPGKYMAKAVNAGIGMSKKNEPQPWIKFAVGGEEITWYGNISNEKGQEITAKALINAGFEGRDIADLNNQFMVVFTPKEVELQIGEYKGKPKVEWVNAPYQKETFKGALPSLSGVFAQVKQELGAKKASKAPATDPF